MNSDARARASRVSNARECVDGATVSRACTCACVHEGDVMRVFSAALGAGGRAARRRVATRARNRDGIMRREPS